MEKYFLKKMTKIHCARGPKRCKTCQEYSKKKVWGLLDLAPDKHPEAARPMTEVEIEGEKVFMTYDVIAFFDTLKDAKEYIEERKLEVEIDNKKKH